MSKSSVVALRAENQDALLRDDVPGAYVFAGRDGGDGIMFNCPCGCGAARHLPVYVEGQVAAPRAWKWNGSLDAPTLEPSIRDIGRCRYHGYLQNGQFTFLEDSGK